MIYWILGFGALCTASGVIMMKRQNRFDQVLKEEEQIGETERLNRLEETVEGHALIIERFERLLQNVDYESQTADEIARTTGMKKGEVLLLKRLLKD